MTKTGVFLNVPFDRGYEPLFIALIAALTSLGRIPRCAIEIPESGQTRLGRIIGLMEECPVSLHDLCRAGTPARFNMPFELGLAYAIRRYAPAKHRHHFVILEKESHRLSRTLSDIHGHDPHIHNGKPAGMIACVIDVLGTTRESPPSARAVERKWRELMGAARKLQAEERRETVYYPTVFRKLVVSATELAKAAGFIP